MDDLDFLALIYSQWSKTTGAENKFWMSEEDTDHFFSLCDWTVWAVDQEQKKQYIASFENEVDADFCAAMHGCLADLVRRLHTAIDEAERFEVQRDEQEGRIAEMVLDYEEQLQDQRDLTAEANDYAYNCSQEISELERLLQSANDALETARADVQFHKTQAGGW